MRLLFALDQKDYEECNRTYIRNSSRAIIIKENKIAMVYSRKYDYYKFPGGGIQKGESAVEALIRETREEAGLIIIPDRIREYGYLHRIQKSDTDADECFIQDNYYYFCQTEKPVLEQKLDDYEKKEGYALEYVYPSLAIVKNRHVGPSPYNRLMFEREAMVLELLMAEGKFE